MPILIPIMPTLLERDRRIVENEMSALEDINLSLSEKEMEPSRFLGHLESAKHGITSSDEEGQFSFWVAGITRMPVRLGFAKTIQEEYLNVPGSIIDVTLLPDPKNQFDPHAVQIFVRCERDNGDHIASGMLGFVPKKISRLVCSHVKSINSGRVVKIRTYTTKNGELKRMVKVGFNYTPEIKDDMERLLESLIDEIT